MQYVKRIICLANSRKMLGRCVAGLELDGNKIIGWIRPVSNRPDGEISFYDRALEDGSEPDLLDVLAIPMLEPCSEGCQTENHLIDDEHYWEKVGEFPKQQLHCYCVAPNPLWVNGYSSTNGTNDRIPERRAHSLPNSLVLIEPLQLTIEVVRGFRGKKQVRANFSVAGVFYNLGVTDPAIEKQYFPLREGHYTYGPRAVACISIGEPFNEYCYKLVASIIPL